MSQNLVVRCKRCGRPLKNPLSIRRGYGPICWSKIHKDRFLKLDKFIKEGDEKE